MITNDSHTIQLNESANSTKYQHCYMNFEISNSKYILTLKNKNCTHFILGISPNKEYDGFDLSNDNNCKGIMIGAPPNKKKISKNFEILEKCMKGKSYRIEFDIHPGNPTESKMKLISEKKNEITIKDLPNPGYFYVDLLKSGSKIEYESLLITNNN